MKKDRKNTAIYVAYEDEEGFDPAMPERNLLRAILLAAMSDAQEGGKSARQAVQFFSCKDEDYIFSFRSICNHLELDPTTILKVVGLYSYANASRPAFGTDAGTQTQTPTKRP